MTIPRFITGHFAGQGGDRQVLKLGIAKAVEIAMKSPQPKVLMAFATQGVMGNVSDVLVEVLGEHAYSLLDKNGSVRFRDGLTVERTTNLLLNRLYSFDGPVVLVLPSDKMFEQVAKLARVTAEIVVPDLPEDAAVWRKSWNPTVLGRAAASPPVNALDPVVMQGLKGLSMTVNFNNGMYNREKRDTIRVFRTLLANRRGLTSEAIVPVLIGTFNWPHKMATEAGEIFDKLKAGRSFPGSPEADPAAFARWELQAKASNDN